MFKLCTNLNESDKYICANALTLQWVHQNLLVLPAEDTMLKLLDDEKVDVIKYICPFKRGSINYDLFNRALRYARWKVVKFLIDHFPHSLPRNGDYVEAPIEIIEALEKIGKIV
jgi:hypothetical protein